MGRKAKFDENIMLESIVKFASICDGKIKASELAKWADENVIGLEGIQGYHFLTSRIEKNQKTGEKLEVESICKRKIDEINSLRNLEKEVQHNLILSLSNIDIFYEQSEKTQRRTISDARKIHFNLIKKYKTLSLEKERYAVQVEKYEQELNQVQQKYKEVEKKRRSLQKEIDILEEKCAYILSHVNKKEQERILKEKDPMNEKFDMVSSLRDIDNKMTIFQNIMDKAKEFLNEVNDGKEVLLNQTVL